MPEVGEGAYAHKCMSVLAEPVLSGVLPAAAQVAWQSLFMTLSQQIPGIPAKYMHADGGMVGVVLLAGGGEGEGEGGVGIAMFNSLYTFRRPCMPWERFLSVNKAFGKGGSNNNPSHPGSTNSAHAGTMDTHKPSVQAATKRLA